MFSPYSPLQNVNQSINWTLGELSDLKAKDLQFSIVWLSILLVVGVIGNALVLYVFYFKFHSSTHRCFILVLAFYDFFACIVGAPFCIAESFHAFTYTEHISCRIFRFILYYTCIASSLTLVLIALERHRKICRPLKPQMTVFQAKIALFLVVGVISTLSAAPSLVFYGEATIPTGVGSRNGTKCFISDAFSQTIWPTIFNVFLLLLAFGSTAIMLFCYIGIARQVSKMGKSNVMKRVAASERTTELPSGSMIDGEGGSDFESDIPTAERTKKGVAETVSLNSTSSRSVSKNGAVNVSKEKDKSKVVSSKWRSAKKMMRHLSSKSGKKTLRITKMLTFVTIAFVFSYLPHLTLMLWSMIIPEENEDSLPTDNVYQVIFYSFLINNLVNPFIYATMDLKFRSEVGTLLNCCKSK